MEEENEHSEGVEAFKEIQKKYVNSFGDINSTDYRSEYYEILLTTREHFLSLTSRIQKIPKEQFNRIAKIVLLLGFCISAIILVQKVIFSWNATKSVPTFTPKLVVETSIATIEEITQSPTLIPLPTNKPIATQPHSVSGCVNVPQLRVRKGPGTDTGLLGGLLFGDCVDFSLRKEQRDGTWLGFEFANSTGWVKAEYIEYKDDLDILEEFNY